MEGLKTGTVYGVYDNMSNKKDTTKWQVVLFKVLLFYYNK